MRYPIARRAPFAHPLRAAILGEVAERPGQTASALAIRLGSDWKTVAHHARVLTELGHLDARVDNGRRLFFPREGTPATKGVLAAASAHTAARVLGRVLERPGVTVPELGEGLGVPESTLRWHLQRLRERGLVARAGAGLAVPPAAREHVRDALGVRGGGAE
ncbi:MAG TPA: helix-turn-helix domain-containing protein [Candidatus Thermoplasmatota archaeon]|nr:helix-turn-helix domain-containing protein [Candidatus Thermoplasmatota archaeon]